MMCLKNIWFILVVFFVLLFFGFLLFYLVKGVEDYIQEEQAVDDIPLLLCRNL